MKGGKDFYWKTTKPEKPKEYVNEISMGKTNCSLWKLKKGKFTGPGSIHAELIKHARTRIYELFMYNFHKSLECRVHNTNTS